jgi:geranylgeranyl pyrophosphate synthase
MNSFDHLSYFINHLSNFQSWPAIQHIFWEAKLNAPSHWKLPIISCHSTGGNLIQAIPAMAAIACAHIGIVLIDDLLDNDPRGKHIQLGVPAAANLASAFLAASFECILQSAASPEVKLPAMERLSNMILTTAHGQYLDAQNGLDEEGYWKIVRTKSSPFFNAALYLGAIYGNSSSALADQLGNLGSLYGEMIQIHDDLNDAFAVPADPDWVLGRPSLPILFAKLVNHPERERFIKLQRDIASPTNLDEAQSILLRCGAISYCIDQLLVRYQQAKQMLSEMTLPDTSEVEALFTGTIRPVLELFNLLRFTDTTKDETIHALLIP